MKALGRHEMGLYKAADRIKRRADRAHHVGHHRQGDRRTFEGIAIGLTVQRLMLTELLEHDHGQQAGARPAPCNDMEWRRRLADLLAVLAAKLLPHRLDHLPLTGNRFQRARHVLAKLAQAIAPQHAQAVAGSMTTRSRGRWSGNVLRSGRWRVNPRTVVVPATACSAASSSSVALASSSSNSSAN
jgi:hypothetical protein